MIDQDVGRIAPETLDKLVQQSTGHGSANALMQAQTGAQACVSTPGAVIEQFSEVFWWHLGAVALPQPYTWSPSELSQLRAAGVALPEMDNLAAWQARTWLMPILLAQERLTLMLPRAGEERHPVWLLVSSLLKGAPITPIESALDAPAQAGLTSAVPLRALPARRRWWQLPSGAISRQPARASYSSLELLFFNPYHWVLQYPAALRASSLLDMADDFRLLGNLAHRLVEQMYRQAGAINWTVSQVQAWFDANLEAMVREKGAVLLMPGKRAELIGFKLRFRHSLAKLHKHLLDSSVVSVTPELALSGDTTQGALIGNCDLLLGFATGGQAVIDMKWAGEKKYRDKLSGQTPMQLGIYAKLQQLQSGAWPAVGYYILKDSAMLTAATGLFPGVRAVDAPAGASAQLWERIAATWAWRKQQISGGSIELGLEGLEPTAESAPPEDAMDSETLSPRYNPFVHLAGWETL